MDSLSQIVLGAATAEAVAGKKLGNKAMVWGAIGGTIPDLDVLVRFEDPIRTMAFHRGYSHSLLFAFVMAPILGYILWKLYRHSEAGWRDWTLLFLVSIGTHPILDCFTTWGTSLLLPFSNERIAWNTIFVVDPLYTLPFLGFLVAAMFKSKGSTARRRLNNMGLAISCLYLTFTVGNKLHTDSVVVDSLQAQNIQYKRFMTNPTPLNNVLWYTVVETDSSFYTGYYSLLDKNDSVDFIKLSGNQQLPDNLEDNQSIKILKFVSDGYYNTQDKGDTVLMNDLRFGIMNGYNYVGDPIYVFTHYIDNTNRERPIFSRPEPNREEMGNALSTMWERLKGI